MSFRTLLVTTLFCTLVSLCPAATITLYNPEIVEPSGGPQVDSSAFGTNGIMTASAIDVLPGNITEYAVVEPFTVFTEVGSGTATSLSASVTTVTGTIQQGASFIGNVVGGIEFYVSGSNSQTISTPITGTAGCTVTAPPSASETLYHCAEVQIFNGTSTTTFFYNATASPIYTLTESTPPPTASATTGVLFPSGVPTGTNAAEKPISFSWFSMMVVLGLYLLNL
ncbi:hypothetical protein CVT26_003334 [Gymnopilus dilepis]|uniref:Uncharacterized protein n=1 Tax=Gymnopilus dilepis TaxID=231916 RepID=A0A409W2W8_9AGAR|nr:hypothetical protein CVT26_003334 [Gymnopilus dilepis]